MFWGVTLESGKRYSQIVESSYHLSMAALEPNSREARKPNKHVSVMIEHGKTEFLLCTLEYERVMQVALDLLFVEGEEVSFFLNGEGIVHLTGYVTDNEDKAIILSDENDEESESSILSDTDDESCSKLMNLDSESESTGEEWTPEKAALKKKKLLKVDNVTKIKASEEKKSQKQSKNTSSTSLTESTENTKRKKKPKDDDEISLSSECDEEMEDEESDGEESDDEAEESGLSSQDDDDEEDESGEETDNENFTPPPPTKKKKSIENNNKSFLPAKSLMLTKSSKNRLNKTPAQNEVPKPSVSSPNIPINKGAEMSASKKKPEALDNKKMETPFRKKSEGDSIHRIKMDTPSSNRTDNTPKTINESSTGKKKKKKRSLGEDDSSSFTETPKQVTPSTKLHNGIKVTDIKQGNGPQAKKGRFVHVCYVGRLNSGQEFDSARDRPFSFRLGCGEVIKGLDTGIEGMKVGGKRNLVIPPNQGYGTKKVGPIPPNSTLQFEVELKAVS